MGIPDESGPRQGDVVIWALPAVTAAIQVYFVFIEGSRLMRDFKGRRALMQAKRCARELAGPDARTFLKDAEGDWRRVDEIERSPS